MLIWAYCVWQLVTVVLMLQTQKLLPWLGSVSILAAYIILLTVVAILAVRATYIDPTDPVVDH